MIKKSGCEMGASKLCNHHGFAFFGHHGIGTLTVRVEIFAT